jgi:nitroreductase
VGTKADISQFISQRWSPRAFDANKPVELDVLAMLFEAARWAPSSSNEQPWNFIVGRNFDECHQAVCSTLNEKNQMWAKNAPVLIITVAKLLRNDRPNRFAFHDVGLATENFFLQACDLGLVCHFMGGFSPDKARELFAIPDGYEAVAAGAVGYMGDIEYLPDEFKERESAPRQRKPVRDFVFTGKWDTPLL